MANSLLLIVDDDETTAGILKVFFESKGYGVILAATGGEGLALALKEIPDIILLDCRLPDIHGFELLSQVKRHYPEISVIVMTGYAEIEDAVNAVKLGAEYYFQKPVELEKLLILVEKSIGIKQMRQERTLHRVSDYPIVGRSKHIQGLIHMINLLAENSSTTVLIRGETGTGKELVARNIHALGKRADKPFIDINCAAIPENILESELFGYEAGAFTDAKKSKKGLLELADGGTLFLDEIGDMPVNAQAKILRVLESRMIKRLGGTRDIPIDVRIIAATNKDLDDLVRRGLFREDLFYRLNVMPLVIPPLRERPEDITLIAGFLLDEIKKSMGKKTLQGFSDESVALLSAYRWPGNVRELRNVIERAAILCANGRIAVENLILPEETSDVLPLSLKEVEKSHIRQVLRMAEGNVTKAAERLGIARSTLNEKIKLYDLR